GRGWLRYHSGAGGIGPVLHIGVKHRLGRRGGRFGSRLSRRRLTRNAQLAEDLGYARRALGLVLDDLLVKLAGHDTAQVHLSRHVHRQLEIPLDWTLLRRHRRLLDGSRRPLVPGCSRPRRTGHGTLSHTRLSDSGVRVAGRRPGGKADQRGFEAKEGIVDATEEWRRIDEIRGRSYQR